MVKKFVCRHLNVAFSFRADGSLTYDFSFLQGIIMSNITTTMHEKRRWLSIVKKCVSVLEDTPEEFRRDKEMLLNYLKICGVTLPFYWILFT